MFKLKTGEKGEARWYKENGRLVELSTRKALRNFLNNRHTQTFDIYEDGVKVGTHSPQKPFQFTDLPQPA